MSGSREAELEERLTANRYCEFATNLREYLAVRREGYRDRLEGSSDEVVRGRAKECKDILNILVDN